MSRVRVGKSGDACKHGVLQRVCAILKGDVSRPRLVVLGRVGQCWVG